MTACTCYVNYKKHPMKKISTLILILLICTSGAVAQQSEVVRNYIHTYKHLAIAEMKRTGVPAAITLAQGIHESGAGKSKLATSSNNHFGIKCKSTWTGEKVYHDDDARGECFRKYSAVEDSYKDHSDFLRNGQRYAFLFQLDPEDYTGWATGLKQAGYATNPKYPQVLIKIVEEYELQNYTLVALGKLITDEDIPVVAVKEDAPLMQVKQQEKVMGQKEYEVPTVTKQENQQPVVNYPAGIFKINETKVIFVQKATSFLAIAKQQEIDLAKIFEFNEIKEADFAPKDMLVYLQRKRKTGADDFYIVQQGESFHDIAQKQGIRMETMLEMNNLNKKGTPVPGTKLYLKGKGLAKVK